VGDVSNPRNIHQSKSLAGHDIDPIYRLLNDGTSSERRKRNNPPSPGEGPSLSADAVHILIVGPPRVIMLGRNSFSCKRDMTMKRTLIATTLIAALISAPQVWALEVSIETKIEDVHKPVVVGKTNLPDGMELIITISGEENFYSAIDTVKISGGQFKSGAFSQEGLQPLKEGTYDLEIYSSVDELPPPSVQEKIGKDGSNLKGPLTKTSLFGGRVIEYKTIFHVGSGIGKAALERERKDAHDWWRQSCKEQCNVVKHYRKSRGLSFDWYKCHADCMSEELKQDKSPSLP